MICILGERRNLNQASFDFLTALTPQVNLNLPMLDFEVVDQVVRVFDQVCLVFDQVLSCLIRFLGL